jgi:HD-GYP domain-containing protein (c-di-GMP phosphodiesterase class II)
MQKLPVDKARPGMVLGKTLYNERGDVLLSRGVTLTAQYIAALKEHGFYTIHVHDGVADDVEPPDILSPRLRNLAGKHLHDVFSLIESVSEVQDEGKQRELMIEAAEAAKPQFAVLYRDVEQIVENVANAETLSGMASLRNHDSYTYDHSLEVTIAGVLLGHRLFLPAQELHQLALGCLCHDIGKLIIPKAILTKPSRLSVEEFSLMRRHPQAGYEAVQHLMGPSDIIARNVVRQHHERQDGTGYPRGLKGSNRFASGRQRYGRGLILPAAEIAGVADVYAALASDRPYRQAMAPAEIVNTIQGMAGSHLNREIVTRFLTVLPTYPISTEVVVISPKLRGYRGIVTDVHPAHLSRPTVRLVFDPQGRTIAPFEVDTSREKDIEIATSSYARLVGFDLTPGRPAVQAGT